MTSANKMTHAKMSKVDRGKLEKLARKKGISAQDLLMEWFEHPDMAPTWALAGFASARYKLVGKDVARRMSKGQLTDRAKAGGNAMHAKRIWGGDPAKMRAAFSGLRRMVIGRAFEAACEQLGVDPDSLSSLSSSAITDINELQRELGGREFESACSKLCIDPRSYRHADAEAYGAFIALRDALGAKPKRSGARRWHGDVEAMRADFEILRTKAGAKRYDDACESHNIHPEQFKAAGQTQYLKYRILRDALGIKPETRKRRRRAA